MRRTPFSAAGHVGDGEQVTDEDLRPGLAERVRAFVVLPYERAHGVPLVKQHVDLNRPGFGRDSLLGLAIPLWANECQRATVLAPIKNSAR
jgi:hypothetical protein